MNRIRKELDNAITALQHVEQGQWTSHFRLLVSFIGFEGHFPERPILPAIVQMLMGVVTAEHICGNRLEISGISNAKFVQPISPDMDVTVSCTPADITCASVGVRLTTKNGLASSFSLQLTPSAVAKEGL